MLLQQMSGYVLGERDPLGRLWIYEGTATYDRAHADEERRRLEVQGWPGLEVLSVTLAVELPCPC